MVKRSTFPANAIMRGEIYWVDIPNAIGHELMKDRPAIIVSCDELNGNSPVVQVDIALLSGLGLAQYGLARPAEAPEPAEPVREVTEDGVAPMALIIAQTERDTYKRMYESLLARMTMDREATA